MIPCPLIRGGKELWRQAKHHKKYGRTKCTQCFTAWVGNLYYVWDCSFSPDSSDDFKALGIMSLFLLLIYPSLSKYLLYNNLNL